MSLREKVFVAISMAVFCIFAVFFMKPSKEKTQTSGVRIAAIMPDVTNSFWAGVWNGVDNGAASANVRLSRYRYATGKDTWEMNEKLETALLSKPEGILLCANQYTAPRTRELLSQAMETGIAVVLCDTDTEEKLRDAYVGADNEKAGHDCAGYLLNHGEIRTAVIIKSSEERISGATRQREQAFLEHFADDSQIQIEKLVLTGEGNDNFQILEEKLLSLGEETALVCFNSSTTILAAQTIERLKMADKVTVVGFSETEEAFSYTQEGVIDALFTQDNEELGRKSVELLEALVQRKAEEKRKNEEKKEETGEKAEKLEDEETKSVIYIDMIPVLGGEGHA